MLPTNGVWRGKFTGRNHLRPYHLLQPQGCGINETPEEFSSNPQCPTLGFAAALLSRKWPRGNQRAVVSFSIVIFSRARFGTRIAPSRGFGESFIARVPGGE